jgi:aryl sulfotransferase
MSELPEVRHIYQNHHLDSTRWDTFKPRDSDIVISTSYKAGTTLTQTIVTNMLFPEGDMPGPVGSISPWLDMRVAPLEEVLGLLESQTHRRCIKTHLPLDGLRYFPQLKYIAVGRDPRDVFMSLLNHWGNHTPEFYDMINNTPGRVGDPFPRFDEDIHKLWHDWITKGWFPWESDGYPYWSHLHHAKTWWEFRQLPNIKLVHYNDLRADLEGEMRKLAEFLDLEVPEHRWPSVVKACEFDTVKANPEKVVDSLIDVAFKGGGKTFINKGTNGRWKGVLTEEELVLYHEAMKRTLPDDCIRWLESGDQT